MPAAASSISESRTHPSWCHSTCLPRGIALMVNIIRHPQSVSDATAAHRDIQIKSWHSRTLAFNAGILVRQAIRESAVEATAPKSETESLKRSWTFQNIPNMSRNMTHQYTSWVCTQIWHPGMSQVSTCRSPWAARARDEARGFLDLFVSLRILRPSGSCITRSHKWMAVARWCPMPPKVPKVKNLHLWKLYETVWNCDKVLNKELSTRGPILGFPKSKIAFSQPTEGWKSTTPYQAPLAPGAPAPSPMIQDGPWHHMDPYGTWSVAIWCNNM